MDILHVNASDIGGGAARAAYRIHKAICEHGSGLVSRMRVIHALSDDPSVISGPPQGQIALWRRIVPRLTKGYLSGFRPSNPTLHTIAWPATGLGKELNKRQSAGQADVVHLHWLGNGTISIEEVGRLRAPLVWTLHDQWAFCGSEHYTHPPQPGEAASSDERFAKGYTSDSRLPRDRGPDVDRATWLRKHRAWKRPIEVVCPSTWMAECARRSALMAQWPITVIPYPLDLKVWAPAEKRQARQLYNLPLEKPLVLFGAIGGTNDPRKGADVLFEALKCLRAHVEGTPLASLSLVVFGQSAPSKPAAVDFPVHYVGRLQDNLSLRLLYAAADVMVVPSRQEAFGQTASEAHACGTPVVAFRAGGLLDIVEDRVTGAVAQPFDPLSLANAIRWVLDNPERQQQLGAAARRRAELLWHPDRVASAYKAVYQRALDKQ